jgi:hypothetical protein
MEITTAKSNKGWNSLWFYIRNPYDAPLPLFTGCMFEAASPTCSWGPVDKKKKRLAPLLGAIVNLKRHDLCSISVIGAYHSRRVAPLMACAIPLFGMGPGMRSKGTTLAQGSLCDSEMMQCIREVLEEPEAVFLVEGHPAIRPDTGFVDLMSTSKTPYPCLAFF